ncbi:MAG: GIY-YIG nuclease family protein [Hyphomonas sp.]
MDKTYWVYILASKKDGALYVGVTSDLAGRVWQHRTNHFSGHTRKYHIRRLVWFEDFARIEDAITCEKRLKRWRRAWKDELIGRTNPDWVDLYDGMFEAPVFPESAQRLSGTFVRQVRREGPGSAFGRPG